jgi:FAD:protein FMN transferase
MTTWGPLKALGTEWRFEFFQPVDSRIQRLIYDEIYRFEALYSRFLSDSFVSLINKNRELSEYTDEFKTLLELGLTYYRQTETVFDISIGNVLEARGYDTDYTFSAKAVDEKNTPITDLLHIGETIVLQGIGNIDLGGLGKGFLLDKLARIFLEHGVEYFLINGGGDIYGTSDHGQPIELLLENPIQPGHTFKSITIYNESLCASSPHKRIWSSEGKQYNHFIGSESEDPVSVFVLAPTATIADMLATTIAIRNDTDFVEYLKTQFLFEALVVS